MARLAVVKPDVVLVEGSVARMAQEDLLVRGAGRGAGRGGVGQPGGGCRFQPKLNRTQCSIGGWERRLGGQLVRGGAGVRPLGNGNMP
mgnify:CR=1 FL=1